MKQIVVEVRPGSSHNKVEKINEEVYKVYLTSQPISGKANEQLLKLLAKYFRVAKSLIQIKIGKTSKTKVIIIMG